MTSAARIPRGAGRRARTTVVLTCAALFATSCGRPPLRLTRTGDGVRVDVQTLGEYPTTVQRAQLTCSGRVIWEVKAAVPSPQIHEFALRTGDNPCYPREIDAPEYRVVIPAPCAGFRIAPREHCRIEVWGRTSAFSRASADFSL